MSFDLKTKIKLSGYYYNHRQTSVAAMIGGSAERMDVIHQEQNRVKKIQ